MSFSGHRVFDRRAERGLLETAGARQRLVGAEVKGPTPGAGIPFYVLINDGREALDDFSRNISDRKRIDPGAQCGA